MSSAQVVAWRNRLSDDLWFYSHGSMDPREVHDNGKEHEPLIKLTDHEAAMAELRTELESYKADTADLREILGDSPAAKLVIELERLRDVNNTLLTGLEALAGEWETDHSPDIDGLPDRQHARLVCAGQLRILASAGLEGNPE